MSMERGQSTTDSTHKVREIANTVGIPDDSITSAVDLYEQAEDDGFMQQRPTVVTAAASVYLGAKQTGYPVFPDEVSAAAEVDRTELLRIRRALDSKFSLDIPPSDPVVYIQRFCDELELPENAETESAKVFESYKEENGVSGSPCSLAAGAIYAASTVSDFEVTQSALSDLADVSEVTIRSRYHEQLEAYEND